MRIGYKLVAECYSPQEIVRQTVRAEEAGFDFVEVSDHFHPWFDSQGHSGFAWSMLAAAAAKTESIELATGVTCPFVRYHPAIIAQAAATTALLSEGRFTLGVGAGEQLSEHIVGQGWPAVGPRHEMFRESLEIIRRLWSGGFHSYDGKHLKLEDARVFDLPETPPQIIVAIGGPASARIAAELGDGIFTTDPDPSLTSAYAEAGGTGPRYTEVPLSWATNEGDAVSSAHEKFRFGPPGLESPGGATEHEKLRVRHLARHRRRRGRDVRLRAGRRAAPRRRPAVRGCGLRPPRTDQRRPEPGRLLRLLYR